MAAKKPPEKHRVRGLNFKNLKPEMQKEVEKIAQIVIQTNCRLDLQIRDSYVDVYYRGGRLWGINHISPRSRGMKIETDLKYFEIDKDILLYKSWLPEPEDGIDAWNKIRGKHEKVMDRWFKVYPKLEREIQHELACNHMINPRSKWLIIDIEYAAWLHGSKEKKGDDESRRLCKFDMIGIERQSLDDDNPIPIYIMELKQGDASIGGASGVISHAEDIAQLIKSSKDRKAYAAFIDSMKNIISEKVELGLFPGLTSIDMDRSIEPRVAFILDQAQVSKKDKEKANEILSHCTEQVLWLQRGNEFKVL